MNQQRVKDFQREHGPEFAKIIGSPAFMAAMELLDHEKADDITNLPNEDVEKYARIILADLRGHMKHEENLMTLHERKTFVIGDLPAETYAGEEPTKKE